MSLHFKEKFFEPISFSFSLILLLIPYTCQKSISSTSDHLEFLIFGHPFIKFELTFVSGSGDNTALIQERVISESNGNQISLSNLNPDRPLLNSHQGFNSPTLVVFDCLNNSKILNILEQIYDFQRANKRGKYWNPIFLLLMHKMGLQESSRINISDHVAKISIGSSVYILNFVESNSTSNSVHIREIYSIRESIIEVESTIQVEMLFDFISHAIFNTKRRSDFRQSTVIAIGVDYEENYPLASRFRPNSTELLSGIDVEVYRFLKDALNFSEKVIKAIGLVRDGPNETLTGYAIQLNNEEGDIAIASGEILESRFKGVDGITYTHPVSHAYVTAFFRQPPSISIRNLFTQAFTLEVWFCFFGIWLTIIVILRCSVKVGRSSFTSSVKDEEVANDSFIWAVGAICQQGWHLSPSSSSAKITFISGIFTALISYAAYSAVLVSMLSVEVVPIRVLDDLLREEFDFVSDLRIPTSVKAVNDLENAHKIPKQEESTRLVDISAKFETLLQTRTALVSIPDSFYPVARKNHTDQFVCKMISQKVVNSRPLKNSCFVKRGSPLREFFNYKLLVMQERGIKFRLMKHYVMGTSIQCLDSNGALHLNFGMSDMFTPFFILIVGISLSLPIVLIEKVYFQKEFEAHHRRISIEKNLITNNSIFI